MKKLLLIIGGCLALSSIHAEDFNYAAEKVIKSALAGDESARLDLQKIDKSFLLDRLQAYALVRNREPERTAAALEMIKTIPSYCQYYRNKIVNDQTGGADNGIFESFKVLAKLKTEESLRIVAEHLYDPTVPTAEGSEDVPPPGPNWLTALVCLSEAKIAGAPTEQVSYEESERLLIEWKAWAKKTYGITSFGGPTSTPPKTPGPASSQPTVAAAPAPSETPNQPSAKPAFPLSAGLVLLAVFLSITAIYYFLNRKN